MHDISEGIARKMCGDFPPPDEIAVSRPALRSLATCALLVVVLGLALCSPLRGSTTGEVSGRILDPQGAAIDHALVTLVNLADSSHRQSTSDEQGRFELHFVELGSYLLRAEAPGFVPVGKTLSVVSGQRISVDMQFARIATARQKVTVLSDAPEAIDTRSSVVETQYNQEDIRTQPGALDTLSALLAHVGTAVVSQEHPHVRGAHQIGYLLNGIEVPDLSIFGSITPFIDPQNLKSVEVETGGLRAEYGNRTAAAVNSIARSGFDPAAHHGLVDLEGGNMHRGSGTLSYGNRVSERFAYYVESRAFFSDRAFDPPPDFLDVAPRNGLGVPDILVPPHSQTAHNFRRTLASFINFDYRASSRDIFNLVMSGYRTDLQIPNDFLQQQAGRDYVEFERDHFENLRYDHLFGLDRLLMVAAFHHFTRLETDGRSDIASDPLASDNRRANYTGSRADYSWSRGKHALRVGEEFYAVDLQDDFLLRPNPRDPRTLPGAFLSNVPAAAYEQSDYTQDQFNATDSLTLSLGLRFDFFRPIYKPRSEPEIKRAYSFFSPRFGFAYRLGRSSTVLFGDFAYMFLPPPIEYFNLRTAKAENLSIFPSSLSFTPTRPEHDVQYDVGVRFPWRGFSVRINQWYKHQIHFLDHVQLSAIGEGNELINPNIFLPINQDGARTYGVEGFIRSPEYRGVSSFLNYSYNVAQGIGGIAGGFDDGNSRVNRFFYLDHHQRNNAYLGVNYNLSEFHAFVDTIVSYGSGFPDASNNLFGRCVTPRCQLPAHATLGAALGKTFLNRIDARLEIENILNKVYPINLGSEFNGSHYSPPRMITLRVGCLF